MTDEMNDNVPQQAQEPEADAQQKPLQWPEDAEYASLYARTLAILIDGVLVLWPLSAVLSWVAVHFMGGPNLSEAELRTISNVQGDQALQLLLTQDRLNRLLSEQLAFLLIAGAMWLGFWYYYSATPGKMLLGMKLVDGTTGNPPRWGQYIRRYLGYIPSLGAFGLGLLWVQWSKRSRAWHDAMADTVVVKKRSLPPELAQATLYRVKHTPVAVPVEESKES